MSPEEPSGKCFSVSVRLMCCLSMRYRCGRNNAVNEILEKKTAVEFCETSGIIYMSQWFTWHNFVRYCAEILCIVLTSIFLMNQIKIFDLLFLKLIKLMDLGPIDLCHV